MSQKPIYQNPELKNTILVLVDYFKELLRKWYVHLFFMLIFGAITFYYLTNRDTTYEARLTFMTNSGSTSKVSSLMRMANSFGLSAGGGEAGLSAEKLAELLVSDRMLKTTLLQQADVDNTTDMLINHFERIFSENANSISPQTMNAEKSFEFSNLQANENKILHDAIEKIKKSGLGVTTSDNGIVRVNFETKHEAFTQKFITMLVENLSNFYTTKTVQQQQETNDMLSGRVDSLNGLLLSKEAELRGWLSRYTLRLGAGSLTPDEFMTKARLEREAEIASSIYKESVQAFEMAKIDLDSSKPIIQIIDYPVLPLSPKMPVPWIFYIAAMIGALTISSVLILFAKLITDALKYENTTE